MSSQNNSRTNDSAVRSLKRIPLLWWNHHGFHLIVEENFPCETGRQRRQKLKPVCCFTKVLTVFCVFTGICELWEEINLIVESWNDNTIKYYKHVKAGSVLWNYYVIEDCGIKKLESYRSAVPHFLKNVASSFNIDLCFAYWNYKNSNFQEVSY